MKCELDLVKVVTQLRMLTAATLGTLTFQTRALAHRMAAINVDHSDTDDHSAVDLEGTIVCYRDVIATIRNLIKSTDSTDRCFFDLARIKITPPTAAKKMIM